MNIYVGNLSFNIKEDSLNEIFTEFGKVNSVKIITDKYTGQSKGFAFVVMDNESDAKQAIENLNGKELESRQIVVNEARPKRESFFNN
jgi:RNA recognition motif-containing protein